jgi:hypothetical protein
MVVAADGWVVEQAGAQAKLAGTEVGLDGGWCGSTTGRCSRRTRMMVGSFLWDVIHGGLAGGQSPS